MFFVDKNLSSHLLAMYRLTFYYSFHFYSYLQILLEKAYYSLIHSSFNPPQQLMANNVKNIIDLDS